LTEENALHRTTIIVIERKGRGVNTVRMQKGNYRQLELYSGLLWGGEREEQRITTRYWTLLGNKVRYRMTKRTTNYEKKRSINIYYIQVLYNSIKKSRGKELL